MSERCPGCGVELPPVATPTHPYIGASPSCWALYGELLARDYTDWQPRAHRLAVDTYAVQHPGGEERRAVQSVAVHLIALCLTVERGLPEARVTRLLSRGVALGPYSKLEPPQPNGTITVRDVLAGVDVEAWATDVWAAWAHEHARIRGWADAAAD